jgi:hypothetical protein
MTEQETKDYLKSHGWVSDKYDAFYKEFEIINGVSEASLRLIDGKITIPSYYSEGRNILLTCDGATNNHDVVKTLQDIYDKIDASYARKLFLTK